MPSQRYKRWIRKSEYKPSVLINPVLSVNKLTLQSKILTNYTGIITLQSINEIKLMLETNTNPQEILTFYDNAMTNIYSIIDNIIKGEDIDLIIRFVECLQNYIDTNMAKYNVLSQEYSDTYHVLDKVRSLLINIIQNIINRIDLNVINCRIDYLTELLDTIRQQKDKL